MLTEPMPMKPVSVTLMRQAVGEVLSNVPTHRDGFSSVEALADILAARSAINLESAKGCVRAVVAFLDLLGLLEWREDESFRTCGQIPHYAIRSLTWYVNNNEELLSNWDRPGIAHDLDFRSVPEAAPYFLQAIELRRVETARVKKIDAGASRIQGVAVLLIKAVLNRVPYFLHQWDSRAEQYQLIGGRLREGESALEAARRELQQEVADRNLVFEKTFYLRPLAHANERLVVTDVSRTYGALTRYEFSFFSVEFLTTRLALSDLDAWIPLSEMRQGRTSKGKLIAAASRLEAFERAVGRFENLPISIELSDASTPWRHLELKPGAFGIRYDLKGLWNDLKSRVTRGKSR